MSSFDYHQHNDDPEKHNHDNDDNSDSDDVEDDFYEDDEDGLFITMVCCFDYDEIVLSSFV